MGIELSELRAEHDPSWIVFVVGPNRVLLRLSEARDLLTQLGQAIADAETTGAAIRWRTRSMATTQPPAGLDEPCSVDTADELYEDDDEDSSPLLTVAEISVPPRGGGGSAHG